MNRVLVPLLLFSGECLAHPGHGAPLIHVHGWDWGHLALGIGMIVAVAIAIRGKK